MAIMYLISAFAFALLRQCTGSEQPVRLPEIPATTVDMIRDRGYECSVHHVTTEDGYVLELHRIGSSKGRPVLLQHGLLSSDIDWISNPSDQSLGYRLIDHGYDVWLANSRGNTYSRRHVRLNPKSVAFWNFTFDEMGRYDLPANIDYILNTTRYEKLIYVGHSMGTTIFYAGVSVRPELNHKIDVMIGLAPVASLANLASPVKILAPYSRLIQYILDVVGTTSFLDKENWPIRLQRVLCLRSFKAFRLCQNLLKSTLALIEKHFPAGTSVRTLVHFAQSYTTGRRRPSEAFRAFDEGHRGNVQRYGYHEPPVYNVSKITLPVYHFWGSNDKLATPKDVAWLDERLVNLKSSVRVEWERFNHLDFLWGSNSNRLVYEPILSLLPAP